MPKKRKQIFQSIIPQEVIEEKILLLRGRKVMLDKDLAVLYNGGTRNLNKAVTRNVDRFPEDFMFQLDAEEFENLMFHFGTSSWGGTRKFPRAFTEQGVAMLSSVLRSKRAIASDGYGDSSRNCGEALRDRRVERRGKEAYS